MGCKAHADAAFLGVKSQINGRRCRLKVGQQAPHLIDLVNYGPLECRVRTTSACRGPLLRYATQEPWDVEQPLPPRKQAKRQTRANPLELPADCDLGRFASYEQVNLEVRRGIGLEEYEKPLKLSLDLKLVPR